MQWIMISLNAPPGRSVSASFGTDGGTIGRAATNTLVLDDPERTVSRMHAQVVCRAGRYFIIDRGSNPMLRNGHTLGAGNEAALNDGDRLTIGGFELTVQALADAASAPVAERATQPAPSAAGGPPAAEDPFADLLAGLEAPVASAAPVSQALPASMSEDMPDPFAAPLAPPLPSAAPQPARNQGALDDFADLATPAGQDSHSIDNLFGSDGGLGGDPLALSPLADPLRQPNTAAAADPLAALVGNVPPPASAPHSDHLPIGQFGFVPPQAIEIAPAAPISAAPPATPPGPVAAAAPVIPPLPVSPPAPAAAKAACPAVAPRADEDALLAALLRGLRDLRQPPEMLTPGLMERIGVLLHDAVQGALQLLLTRQEFKHELRAEVTMIATQANNPLKFSPSVEVALAHLLGPGVRGFMPAEAAVRDAFDDLRAHQFGVMVGTRAALAQLIARFAPDDLEKKITAKSALDNLFTAHRKAKLWDQFVRFYAEIATEAEEDFHSFFGKAFVQAYEEQMARFKAAEPSDQAKR